MKKKICFITGSRAEFDLIKSLLLLIENSNKLELHLVVTATHLSKEYGMSVNYINKFNFKYVYAIKTHINKKTNTHNLESISLGITKISKLLLKIKPNLLSIAGDRYEMLSSAISAYFLNIPIAHFFGGEITTGSLDDGIRHTLTKLSNFHFVTHKNHLNRVIQLGEEKKNIFLTNHIGFDSLLSTKLISKKKLSSLIGISLSKKSILIVFHPENSKKNVINDQAKIICESLNNFKNYNLIFNKPNSDNHSNIIDKVFKKYVKLNDNAYYINNLGHQKYLSLLNCVEFIIGNSSSGLSEMPFFFKPTINLGKRQLGRPTDPSVINSSFNKKSISQAILKSTNPNFLKKITLGKTYYNYKLGGSKKVFQILLNILEKLHSNDHINKKFIDLKFN